MAQQSHQSVWNSTSVASSFSRLPAEMPVKLSIFYNNNHDDIYSAVI